MKFSGSSKAWWIITLSINNVYDFFLDNCQYYNGYTLLVNFLIKCKIKYNCYILSLTKVPLSVSLLISAEKNITLLISQKKKIIRSVLVVLLMCVYMYSNNQLYEHSTLFTCNTLVVKMDICLYFIFIYCPLRNITRKKN